jgi:hypothetical protein
MSSGIFEKSSISSFAWAIQRGFSNVAEQRAGLLPINAAVYPIPLIWREVGIPYK